MMFTDVSKSTEKPTEHPLEALRSPDTEVFRDRLPERESIAESDFNEIALDDDSAFSPVALTSQRGSGSNTPLQGEGLENGRPQNMSPQADFNPKKPSHKKSASMTTIRSANNLPFILARLDLQDDSGAGHRGSVDGQQKLQEEFARLHREEEEVKENARTGAIDWGA
jgi:hypothetical protein